jgi:hypothetical protein
MSAVNSVFHPDYSAQGMDVALPSVLGAMFLLVSCLMLG